MTKIELNQILAQKARGRRANAAKPFVEKLAILDRMREEANTLFAGNRATVRNAIKVSVDPMSDSSKRE